MREEGIKEEKKKWGGEEVEDDSFRAGNIYWREERKGNEYE